MKTKSLNAPKYLKISAALLVQGTRICRVAVAVALLGFLSLGREASAGVQISCAYGKDMWGFPTESFSRIGLYQEIEKTSDYSFSTSFDLPVECYHTRIRWAGLQLRDKVSQIQIIFGMVGKDFNKDNNRLGIVVNDPGFRLIPLDEVEKMSGRVWVQIKAASAERLIFSVAEKEGEWKQVYELELSKAFHPGTVALTVDQYHGKVDERLPLGPVTFYDFKAEQTGESDDFSGVNWGKQWRAYTDEKTVDDAPRGTINFIEKSAQ